MRHWLRRARGALLVGVTWALAWGIGGGGLMELIFDPDGRIADIWPMVLGIPGFFAGIIFSIVLAATERHRRFDELSLPRFGAWGALAGALLGVLGIAVFGAGPLVLIPFSVLGAASASGSLALARAGMDRDRIGTGVDRKIGD
jgi:hypothetical protein